ncbi:MAG: polyprenyl synthetase family protein [Planctomycetota bacterium]|jgi:geranylgeranyl pyrophosphate synthase
MDRAQQLQGAGEASAPSASRKAGAPSAGQVEDRAVEEFLAAVRRTAEPVIRKATGALVPDSGLGQLFLGKMLRSRLAARLVAGGASPADRTSLERLCAATEMVHTATLLHDDVMDNGLLRRALPTLWTQTSTSAAILIGDVLLCKAIDLLATTEGGRYTEVFTSKVAEVCTAEAEQEIFLRGKPVDKDTCLRLARQKTGPLFAFVGLVSGGDDADLAEALEEAGYRVGAAYQIFDDLVDVCGSEDVARKTLGTDVARRKYTLAQETDGGAERAANHVIELCVSVADLLAEFPSARPCVEAYLECDLEAVFATNLEHTGVKVGLHS